MGTEDDETALLELDAAAGAGVAGAGAGAAADGVAVEAAASAPLRSQGFGGETIVDSSW